MASKTFHEQYDEVLRQNTALQKRLEQAIGFGGHKAGCEYYKPPYRGTTNEPNHETPSEWQRQCTCGWEAFRAKHRSKR